MNEQSPLPYRLAMYASAIAGYLLGLYGYWGTSAVLMVIAIFMQWRRIMPTKKFEWARWMGVVSGVLLLAIDIYGMIDPAVEPFFGQ